MPEMSMKSKVKMKSFESDPFNKDSIIIPLVLVISSNSRKILHLHMAYCQFSLWMWKENLETKEGLKVTDTAYSKSIMQKE